MFCRYLAVIAFCLAFFMVAPALGQIPNLIQPPVEGALSSPMLVTATASNGQVQFVALTPAQQIRLEILSQVGESLFDSDFHPGNLLRWEVKDQQGSYLQDGLYGCLVTVEDLNGQVSHRKGAFQIKDGMFWFQGQQQSGMTTEPAVQDQDNLIILQPDSPLTLAVHDDQGGLIESGRGALDFHAGTFSPTPGNTVPHMRLTPEGNLGIGVATPEAKLDVAGLIKAREGIQFADGTVLKMDGGNAILVSPRGPAGAGITSPGRTGFTNGTGNGSTAQILTSAKGIRPMATSGTSGQIAKFTNSTDLVNSVITESAGNIGIGTTGPSVPLELSVAQARFNMISTTGTNNARIRFNNTGGDSWVGVESSGAGTMFTGDSAYAAVFGTSSSYPVQFATNSLTRMTVATNGNVGIGTTGPGAALDVQNAIGRINLTSTTGANRARLAVTNTGGTAYFGVEQDVGGQFLSGDTGYATVIAGAGTYPIHFGHSSPEVTILNSGNVGIGTVNPGTSLQISSNAGSSANASKGQFYIAGLNALTGGFVVDRGVANEYGYMNYQAGALRIGSRGGASSNGYTYFDSYNGTTVSTRMVIDNLGNVGIGTTGPSVPLELSVAAARFNMISTTGTNNARIRFNNTSGDSWVGVESSVGGTLFSGDSAYATVFGTSSSYPVQFATNSITRMTVDNSGNVGIGTASPGAKLEIAGNMKLSGSGNGITFPDGTTQTTASGPTAASFAGNTPSQIVNVTQLGSGVGINVVSAGSGAVVGEADNSNAAGVRGIATATTGGDTKGVVGTSASDTGVGVYGEALGGSAIGVGGHGGMYGVVGAADNNTRAAGVWGIATATTDDPTIGVVGISASNMGAGVYGGADGAAAYGVVGQGGLYGVYGDSSINSGGTGVYGAAQVDGGTGVSGIGNRIGVTGTASQNNGTGVYGAAQVDGGTGVSGIGIRIGVSGAAQGNYANGVNGWASGYKATAGYFHFDKGSNNGGNILIGAITSSTSTENVFRVDLTGKGFFNGGTQTGGADFAEAVMPVGSREDYQPGDVLVIDQATSRSFRLSSQPYSTAVAGIYSTKPGVLATPHPMDDAHSSDEIPLAVVGIVPCKVSAENGAIERGDLLVTSSTLGYAMKGTDRMRMLGAIVGKALDPLPQGTGVIRVLVTLQ